jgi:hypothetical protein
MFQVPPYVINALNSVTKRRVVIEWSNDRFLTVGGSVDAYDAVFTCDANAQVRWSATASVIDMDDRINNKTTWMRAYLEIKGMRSAWWRIPMGVYRLYGITRSDRFADLTLDGLEAVVRDHTFHVPRTLPLSKSDSRKTTLTKLLRESIPNVPIAWLIKESSAAMPKVSIERDRWSVIDGDNDAKSIAGSLAADCYADRIGQFVVMPTPLDTNNPVWEITVDSGVKVSSATTLSRENMKNVWTVWAEPGGNKKNIGPVHVWDTDRGSDTYAGVNPIKYFARDSKAFGIVPGYYQNPILKDTKACESVGRKRLAQSLAFRRSVSITSIFNPTLDAGDCIALIPDGSQTLEGFILESVAYSIEDASTALQMRTKGPPAFAETADDEGSV